MRRNKKRTKERGIDVLNLTKLVTFVKVEYPHILKEIKFDVNSKLS